MNKLIAIIAGEPNSISSEIIFKSWQLRKKYSHKTFFVIGSVRLLNLQKEKLNYKIKIKKINSNLKISNLKGIATTIGGNIIIPMAIKTDAITISKTKNGI